MLNIKSKRSEVWEREKFSRVSKIKSHILYRVFGAGHEDKARLKTFSRDLLETFFVSLILREQKTGLSPISVILKIIIVWSVAFPGFTLVNQ